MGSSRQQSSNAAAGLAATLKAWALEAGFDRAGVARLEPSAHGAHLRRWLERGDQAGMAWMARRLECRLDPARLLPQSRSALCVALHYHPLAREGRVCAEPRGDLWPRVARYARGDDYHELVQGRLRRLGERIEAAFPGAKTRAYVDTGPILERELHARAGIGRIGKNTNLLDRQAGSWFLVGELLLTLELAPDAPATDMCGSCTRCLDACPTGALPEPYRLDSNRCISYWTIEHRGAVPREMRPRLGDWVFGCDVCQEVCPWNHRPAGGEHAELELPPRRRDLDLVGLLLLEREEYVERFRRSPMKRARLEGLKRNAALALGNRYAGEGEEGLLEGGAEQGAERLAALGRALTADPSPVVRGHAAWALGRLGGPAAGARLLGALASEQDPSVRDEIQGALDDVEAAPRPNRGPQPPSFPDRG